MAELTERDRDRIRTITEREWVATCSAGDWDAAAALCTEDVDYMPADLPWLRGREAVAGFLRDFPEFSGFHQEVVKISGDSSLAVVHATFGIDLVVEGQTLSGEGKVLVTASKAEGDWLFSSVCFNWNAPPAPTQ